MLAAVVGGLAIAHSTGQGQELIHGSSSLLDTIALVPSPSPGTQTLSKTPVTCDERCRTIWGLGAYGDWDRKCSQERCSACAECTNDAALTPLDLCKKRYDNAIVTFPPLETDREARLRGDKSLDAADIPHVLFVHIGKTCGDTVIAALNHNKRKIMSLDMSEQQEDEVTNKVLAKYKAAVREPFDMVHVHPVRTEVLENVHNVLIPMRDPVDRLISAYNSAACKADGVEDHICERKAPPHSEEAEEFEEAGEFEESEDVSESEALRVGRLNMPPRQGLGPMPAVGGLIMQCFPNVTAFGDGIDDDTECGRVARDMIGMGATDAGAGHVGKGDCYYLGGVLDQLRTKRIHLIHTVTLSLSQSLSLSLSLSLQPYSPTALQPYSPTALTPSLTLTLTLIRSNAASTLGPFPSGLDSRGTIVSSRPHPTGTRATTRTTMTP